MLYIDHMERYTIGHVHEEMSCTCWSGVVMKLPSCVLLKRLALRRECMSAACHVTVLMSLHNCTALQPCKGYAHTLLLSVLTSGSGKWMFHDKLCNYRLSLRKNHCWLKLARCLARLRSRFWHLTSFLASSAQAAAASSCSS